MASGKALSTRQLSILAAALLAALLVAVGVWMVTRALLVADHLHAASEMTHDLRSALEQQDVAAARAALTEFSIETAAAAQASGDPLWRGFEVIPVVGANLAAARVSSVHLDALAARVGVPLLDLARGALAHTDDTQAGLDVRMLREAEPVFADAAAAMRLADTEVGALDRRWLVPQLAQGVTQIDEIVSMANEPVQMLARLGEIAPAMLGADGERAILLVAQNNAELRTGGGVASAFVEFRARDGRLSIEKQRSSADFARGAVEFDVPDDLATVFGDTTGEFVMNATLPADFDVTARLVSAWWQSAGGDAPDAVVAVDPHALRALLSVAGPVTVDGREYSSDNVVHQLLVEPYLTLTEEEQDALFQQVAAETFTPVIARPIAPLRLVEALAAPVEAGRLSVWSAHAAEQDVLASTPLAGPEKRHMAAGDGAFAIYLNDTTQGKMDSFLEVSFATGSAVCRTDGIADVTVAVTLTSTAPADAAHTLPGRMTGEGLADVAPGNIGTLVTVAGPRGAFYGGALVDETPVAAFDGALGDHPTSTHEVVLAPGESTTLDFHFFLPAGQSEDLALIHTPLLNEPEIGERKVVCS
ncbi:DUF4012 domain-containing protein [Microbacterium lacticum]